MENSDDGVIEEVESSNGSRKENSSCAKKKKVWDLRMNVKLEVWGLRSGMKNRGYK